MFFFLFLLHFVHYKPPAELFPCLQITLDKKSLSTELKITNTDKKPFSFTTALHTYFSVSVTIFSLEITIDVTFLCKYLNDLVDFVMQASVSGASVRGLKGCKTLNKDPDPKNPVEGKEERYHRLVLNLFIFLS